MTIFELQEMARHISILNEDYTKMSIDIAILKTQMADIMWWFRAIAGSILAVLITQAWQLVKMHKK